MNGNNCVKSDIIPDLETVLKESDLELSDKILFVFGVLISFF